MKILILLALFSVFLGISGCGKSSLHTDSISHISSSGPEDTGTYFTEEEGSSRPPMFFYGGLFLPTQDSDGALLEALPKGYELLGKTKNVGTQNSYGELESNFDAEIFLCTEIPTIAYAKVIQNQTPIYLKFEIRQE